MNQPNPDAQFGSDDCTCVPFTRQTNPPRYLNRPTDTVDMISGWERGRDCPHHAPAAQSPDRPFRDEPTEVLQAALDLATTHAQQAARFRAQQPGDALPAVADLFQAELQHRTGGRTADCRTCGAPIGWVDCPTGGWWAHDQHPTDDHDAEPAAQSPAARGAAPTDWIDGHPQLEAIAAAVWEQCTRSDSGLVIDDPRNIAVAALGAITADPAAEENAALWDELHRRDTETDQPHDADRAALRDRIRRVLAQSDGFDFDCLESHDYQIQAAAILAVLPATADRAVVRAETLREAADALAEIREATDVNVAVYPRYDAGQKSAISDGERLLRRLAGEQPCRWEHPHPGYQCEPRTAGEQPAQDEARQQCLEQEPLIGAQCTKQGGHDGAHSDRPGRIWYPVPDEGAPTSRCTCADAGDCFAPAGHYADCPLAAPPSA